MSQEDPSFTLEENEPIVPVPPVEIPPAEPVEEPEIPAETPELVDTIYVYTRQPNNNEEYYITKIDNTITIGSGIPDDDLIPRIVSFDITTLKPYVRYFVLYSNLYNKFILSNTEDIHVPYSGSFIDIYALNLILTSMSNYVTIWKTEANEIFFLGHHCKIIFEGITLQEGTQVFSEWLQENSADPNCADNWLSSWDEVEASVNQRRELMFRGLPVLDVQTDILLHLLQAIFEEKPELRAALETKVPGLLDQFDAISALSIYNVKTKTSIDTILSDKARIREIQAKYSNVLTTFAI